VVWRVPRQHRAHGWSREWSAESGGLPAETGKLAGARDSDHARGLVALATEHGPALMQPAPESPARARPSARLGVRRASRHLTVVDERHPRAQIIEPQGAQPAHVLAGPRRAGPSQRKSRRKSSLLSRCRARIRSPRQSPSARTTSRNCTSATVGTNANLSSPAASNLTSRSASRRSVLTRSPDARATLPAATTRKSIPRPFASRASPNAVGPPHTQHEQDRATSPQTRPPRPAPSAASRHEPPRSAHRGQRHASAPHAHQHQQARYHDPWSALPRAGCRQQARPATQSPHISAPVPTGLPTTPDPADLHRV
jgi:hypothetical protein